MSAIRKVFSEHKQMTLWSYRLWYMIIFGYIVAHGHIDSLLCFRCDKTNTRSMVYQFMKILAHLLVKCRRPVEKSGTKLVSSCNKNDDPNR